jgi:hypothetical protein
VNDATLDNNLSHTARSPIAGPVSIGVARSEEDQIEPAQSTVVDRTRVRRRQLPIT